MLLQLAQVSGQSVHNLVVLSAYCLLGQAVVQNFNCAFPKVPAGQPVE